MPTEMRTGPHPGCDGHRGNFQGVQRQSTVPTGDAESSFAAAMAEAGIVTSEPILADGQLHRIHVEGHRRGTKNAAYVLHGDGRAAGWFQDFVTGTKATWKAEDN